MQTDWWTRGGRIKLERWWVRCEVDEWLGKGLRRDNSFSIWSRGGYETMIFGIRTRGGLRQRWPGSRRSTRCRTGSFPKGDDQNENTTSDRGSRQELDGYHQTSSKEEKVQVQTRVWSTDIKKSFVVKPYIYYYYCFYKLLKRLPKEGHQHVHQLSND